MAEELYLASRRAYQNVLVSLGGTEYPIALQLAPALLGGILTNIAGAFDAVCTSSSPL
jgi:hypothetical protein